MCCLKYEQDNYEALLKITPRPGSIVQTSLGRGVVEDKAIKISNYTQAKANENIAVIKAATALKQYEMKCAEEIERSKKAQSKTKNAINSAKDSTTDPETQRILNKYFGEMTKELQNIMSQNNQLLTSMKSALTDFVNEAEKKADAENNR